MSIVPISPQDIASGGVAPSYTGSLVANTNTYTASNDGRVFLHFKKTGAGICTVTVVTPATYKGAAVADQTFTVPASTGDVMYPLQPKSLFTDGNGDVSFTCSEVTGLTVAVLRLPPDR